MFSILRQPRAGFARAFSSTAARSSDLSKVILIGRLGKNPEIRTTKGDQEFISYSVATTNFPPPPLNSDGTRPESKTTWHNVHSFNPYSNNYLCKLQKGSHVYVEANLEVREPEPGADPRTPEAHRQILLRHEMIRLLRGPFRSVEENNEEWDSEEKNFGRKS